ncbi:anaerobic ribonucleoside-triphosphate reductase, partial [Vibrio anguillarum]
HESVVVVKRDGAKATFNAQLIKNAVQSAAKSINCPKRDLGDIVAANVCEKMNGRTEIEICDIQSLVEKELMHVDEDVARAYIEYRHDRDIQREKASALSAEISGLVEQSNADLLNENANKDSKVIPTQRDLLAGIISKHYAKHHMLPRDIVQAHENGEIHYHDLDYSPFFPMFNCMIVDLENMLKNGF